MRRPRLGVDQRARHRFRLAALGLAATGTVAVLGGITAATVQPANDIPDVGENAYEPGDLTRAESAWANEVVASLETTSWPTLSPTMNDAIDSPEAPSDVVACGASDQDLDLSACTWGSRGASRTAMIVGDSISLTYVDPLRAALDQLDPDNWQVTSAGTFGCPFVDLELGSSRGDVDACSDRRAQSVQAIARMRPDVLFISDSADTPAAFSSGDSVSEPEWRQGLAMLLDEVRASGTTVVFLAPPPGDTDIEECYTPLSSPADCVGTVSAAWADRAETEQDLAATVGGAWIDSEPWFCNGGVCPSFVDGTPVRSDTVHMTIDYGQRIVPLLASSLRADLPELAPGRALR